MLESYDMPMLDYPSDLDIQMHPSSSDQWFQDEAQMEEDGPLKIPENDTLKSMKTDIYAQEKPIEVDMESSAEHHNVEYDMVDDDEIQQSGAELLDVEVYDISLAHSPAMVTFDAHEPLSDNLTPFDHEDSDHAGLPTTFPNLSDESQGLQSFEGNVSALPVGGKALTYEPPFDTINEAVAIPELSSPLHVQEFEADHLNHREIQTEYPMATQTATVPAENQPTDLIEQLHGLEPVEEHDEIEPLDDTAIDHFVEPARENRAEQIEVQAISASPDAPGDPHEISEGVYIDPPPPVLLSISSEDHYDFSFFNESPEWSTSSGTNSRSHLSDHVVLHHLPTLYYEPISAVFDALRQEDFLQSMFQMAESELVLEAVDLQLIISEDNVYAREVTLHDLNVLHDVSGISGLLRMRLYVSTPRFISRYQYLQEQVSRLNLELPSGEIPAEPISEPEAFHEGHLEPQEVERGYEADPVDGALDELVDTPETPPNPKEPGNEANVHHDEAPSDGLTTESYEEAPELPPLPADTLEDEDTANPEEEKGDDITKLNLISPVVHVRPPVRSSTAEVVNQPVDSLSNDSVDDHNEETIALEVLEAAIDDESYSEEQHFDTFHNSQDEEERPGFEAAEDYDDQETHGAEEQVDEKLDTLESTVDELEGSDSTALVEAGGGGAVELGVGGNAHANLEEDDLFPYQKTDNLDEEIVESDNIAGGEKEVNIGPNASITLGLEADPVPFEDGWEDDLDGEGEADTTWDDDNENALSNHSSVTLSSKASKRSFDEFESGDAYDDGGESAQWTPPSSPDPKRSRTQ
ncbi:hypothetical protein GALMADRAFT_239315 [Galerina marginata CBS 339.88]|uniref:Uncharacterized protein n=1 Tax=Galerina marginata (strain CBS 339.88) TaxID=685588 RepID=A0A067TE59_GALM3|nr:hypothetical protein GALMADRAFT_239315 [Galerina marginata CBS 339.88]